MSRDPDESSIEQTIEALVGDLRPVVPVRLWRGMILGLGLTALSVGGVWLTFGLRPDVLTMHPAPIVIARGAALLAGGLALLVAALRAALPGRADQGATTLGTMILGILPIGLMGLLLDGIVARQRPNFAEIQPFLGMRCLGVSLAASLLIGGGLAAWMRRAAPTDLARAGWLTGWAVAALGTFAYSLFCPSQTMAFMTAVYPTAMLLAAIVIRFAIPPLLRW
ncbi:hypothetical protein NSE01_33340 [Novosphingobium sediminis]|uniref:DUF1109 domain-containing protein n=1 Tax=Novosphingobium sediminis TaxID=707214 RepID=A0A512AP67_9SPHN|nr:NrsF family protein [Novosphingobium sediminis]GEO01502.1 hypothetical protein NSE01_33340 [Novosphingobium sediminis]